MKLLLCKSCEDVFRLTMEERTCSCGHASGKYLDNIGAVYTGKYAVPLGFDNRSFAEAVRDQPDGGDWGRPFTAFVIQRGCPTFKDRTRRKGVDKPAA